jgi:hypothetical protein
MLERALPREAAAPATGRREFPHDDPVLEFLRGSTDAVIAAALRAAEKKKLLVAVDGSGRAEGRAGAGDRIVPRLWSAILEAMADPEATVVESLETGLRHAFRMPAARVGQTAALVLTIGEAARDVLGDGAWIETSVDRLTELAGIRARLEAGAQQVMHRIAEIAFRARYQGILP